MNTKHVAKIIENQVQAIDQTQKAYQAVLDGLEKQKVALNQLAEAFELEGATPSEIRLRAFTKPKK